MFACTFTIALPLHRAVINAGLIHVSSPFRAMARAPCYAMQIACVSLWPLIQKCTPCIHTSMHRRVCAAEHGASSPNFVRAGMHDVPAQMINLRGDRNAALLTMTVLQVVVITLH
jgi:hypothetical protein